MRTLTMTRAQVKHFKLEAHYDLFEEVFGNKFDTNFVPGVGDLNSPVVFIGESPGTKENEACEPFVGASGKLLNEGLKYVGLKRGDVFITNFLKYQPPGNRDPEGDEVNACQYMLEKELEILAPKAVVTLGRFSTSLFFEQPHMATLAGQVWHKHGYIIVPMYHPASVLYGGQDREDWLEDFDAVADVMRGLVPTATSNGHRKSLRKAVR